MFCERAVLTGANTVIWLVVRLKVPDSPLPCTHNPDSSAHSKVETKLMGV